MTFVLYTRIVYQLIFKYTPLDVPGNSRSLPEHIQYTVNDYSLCVPFIVFWEVLVSSKLFIAYRSYKESSSCSPSNLSSVKSWYLRRRSKNSLPFWRLKVHYRSRPPLQTLQLQVRTTAKILMSAWNSFSSKTQIWIQICWCVYTVRYISPNTCGD